MAITTKNGIYMPALNKAKHAQQSGHAISQKEAGDIVKMMKGALLNEYEGQSSSKGLATDRNVLARTTKAIFKNSDDGKWNLTNQGKKVFHEAFGAKLDGKTGQVSKLVDKIRDDVKANSTGFTYFG
ncbi:MAG TPA: hypothetical protein VGO62_00350 [Myxococcota bacterium]